MNKENELAKIAKVSNLTSEQVAIVKNTVAKGTTDLELAYFLQVANSYQLSPFKKELWCYRDNKDNLIIFAGRDGHLSAAQKDSRWNGIASSEVRTNDKFVVDIPNGNITHSYSLADRGKIIGAYAICRPKGCDIATIEVVEFETYNKGYNTWKSDPAAMIKKVAETHCLKKAYGLSGLQSEYDWSVNEVTQTAIPIDHDEQPTMSHIEYIRSLVLNSTFDDDGKDQYEAILNQPNVTFAELDQVRDVMMMNQLDPIKQAGRYNQGDIKKELFTNKQ